MARDRTDWAEDRTILAAERLRRERQVGLADLIGQAQRADDLPGAVFLRVVAGQPR